MSVIPRFAECGDIAQCRAGRENHLRAEPELAANVYSASK